MLRKPLVMEMCSNELWEGVSCVLPAGHKGPHHRPAMDEGAALSWRSSSSSSSTACRASEPRSAMFTLATIAR
jgi:hypothetical protein